MGTLSSRLNEYNERADMGSGVSLLTIGNFAGEEWVFDKQYVQRKESCLAKDDSCVLEFTKCTGIQKNTHEGEIQDNNRVTQICEPLER